MKGKTRGILGLVLLPFIIILVPSQGIEESSLIQNRGYDTTVLLSDNGLKPVIRWQEIKIEATAYCSCKYCTGWGKNITASGVTPSRGTVAAPRHIPFGTVIKLDGLGEFTVQDRGGGIKLKNGVVLIDVWMESHQEALKFGRKKLKGWIKVEQ